MVCKRVRGWERFWFIMFRKILSPEFLSHFMSQKICLLDWLVFRGGGGGRFGAKQGEI